MHSGETKSGHPDQLDHIMSGSSRSNPLLKISESDLDSKLDHVY